MTVKTIFKALIGTIAIIVISSCLIELFNISVTGMQIRQMTKMAARQACVLFTQETYKTGGGKGAVNLPDIPAADGTRYITGNFYTSSDARAIWQSIFTSTDFKNFTTSGGRYADTRLPAGYGSLQEAFPDLEILALSSGAKYDPVVANAEVPGWNAAENSSAVINYNKKIKAQGYKDSMFTTVNLGIPYMDDEIVAKMFRWNLAQILSNTSSLSIQNLEGTNKYFVNYKGFECYASEAKILDYTYKCYNLDNAADKEEFKQVSNMLTASRNGVAGGGTGTLGSNYERDDNNIVTVVSIKYSVPVSYKGITPIRNIFNYVWSHEVAGLDGEVDGNLDGRTWNTETQDLVGGNIDGALSTLGELTYILVR